MKLLFKDELIGFISVPSQDGLWMSGNFDAAPTFQQYASLFRFLTDETKGSEDPPFPPDQLDEHNWWIEQNDGRRVGIEIPAIHEDGSIDWKWRE